MLSLLYLFYYDFTWCYPPPLCNCSLCFCLFVVFVLASLNTRPFACVSLCWSFHLQSLVKLAHWLLYVSARVFIFLGEKKFGGGESERERERVKGCLANGRWKEWKRTFAPFALSLQNTQSLTDAYLFLLNFTLPLAVLWWSIGSMGQSFSHWPNSPGPGCSLCVFVCVTKGKWKRKGKKEEKAKELMKREQEVTMGWGYSGEYNRPVTTEFRDSLLVHTEPGYDQWF